MRKLTYVAELLEVKFGRHIFIYQNIILKTKEDINNILLYLLILDYYSFICKYFSYKSYI